MQTNNTCKVTELIERAGERPNEVWTCWFFSMSFTKWWQTYRTRSGQINIGIKCMQCMFMVEGAKPPQPPQKQSHSNYAITRCLSRCVCAPVFIESVFLFFTIFIFALFRFICEAWAQSQNSICTNYECNACFLRKNAHVCKAKCVDLFVIIVSLLCSVSVVWNLNWSYGFSVSPGVLPKRMGASIWHAGRMTKRKRERDKLRLDIADK